MKALLICPVQRPSVAALAQANPLPTVPILGKALVELWIEQRASLGAKQIWISASERPDEVRRLVGSGAKWGVRVEVIPDRCELTLQQAREKFRRDGPSGWLSEPNDVAVMDHLPEQPGVGLFASYANFVSASIARMPHAATPDRIGITEQRPGIWIGRRTRVERQVELRPPCWLGENVYVGAGSIVGPRAILEDRVFVEGSASITDSVIGPETFVGTLTEMRHSVAWGNLLIDWNSGSSLEVPDPFVLSSLAVPIHAAKRPGRLSRLMALLTLVLTSPCGIAAAIKSKLMGQPIFRRCLAVSPQFGSGKNGHGPVAYYELENVHGWLRRWPQLWNVVRGEFTWVGNRPLSPDEADELECDFERLWLSAPIGLISLADAMGCGDSFDDETRAHASFYAVQSSRRLDASILTRALLTSRRRPTSLPERHHASSDVPALLSHAENQLENVEPAPSRSVECMALPRHSGGRLPPDPAGWKPALQVQVGSEK